MFRSLLLIAAASLVFVVTNIDGFLILLSFFADRRYGTGQVVVGEYIGMAALVAVSILVAFLSLALRSDYLGLLGFCPLAIGVWGAFTDPKPGDLPEGPTGGALKTMAVALVTVSNGVDNIGSYVPFFSTLDGSQLRLVLALFWVLTALLCVLAYGLVHMPWLAFYVQRYGMRIRPWVLMALGSAVLIRTNAFRIF